MDARRGGGQNAADVPGPNTDRVTRRKIREALRNWKPINVEILNYRKDGAEFWVELNIVPVADEAGRFTHWVSVQRETTQRRKELLALEQARDEAQRANLAKSEFLSRMSHELRTPLNAILGFGQLLEMSKPTERQGESISHVLRGGRHLLDLINEVLDIARIESGKIELNLEPVHMASALAEAVALVHPLATERGIVLSVAKAEQALDGITVCADRQRLKQVLLNLIGNGIKYNQPNGKVELSCAQLETNGLLRVSVRDDGPGISAEDLPKLFAPFERLGAVNSEVEGTGIGLAISKRLIEAMGGSVSVQSALDQGSTFSFELPVTDQRDQQHRDAARREAAPEPPGDPTSAKHKILYIEDNLSNLSLIQAIMSRRTDSVLLSAVDGEAGLELARRHLPDLVLLDLNLPDFSGDEVLSRLKEDEALRDIPVVMVSADATETQIERLLQLGAYKYLTKPFDLPEFMQIIDEACARQKPAPAA